MTRAIELLKNSFGVSQLYQHDVVKDGTLIISVYWHPLTFLVKLTEFFLNYLLEQLTFFLSHVQ